MDRNKSNQIQTLLTQVLITTKFLKLKRALQRKKSKICITRSVMSIIQIAQEACTKTNSRKLMSHMKYYLTARSEKNTTR